MCTCTGEHEETERGIIVRANRLAHMVGSCNFCSRQIGQHGTESGAHVVEISSADNGGMRARMCYTCLYELKRQTE